ncbi:unnamed protein product, partial [Amoebophrya sp. A25]
EDFGKRTCELIASLRIPPQIEGSAGLLAQHRAALVRLGGDTIFMDFSEGGGYSNLFRCGGRDPYRSFWSKIGAMLFSTRCVPSD